MRSNLIFVAILGIACMMIGVNGNNTTSSSSSIRSWISSNMTTNLTQALPPNITTNLNQTSPANITNILPQTRPPNITTNLTQTQPPNITTNLNQTSSANITNILPQTQPPNITTNLNQTSSANITNILPQTQPPNITTNLNQTSSANITNILPQTQPPNITTNLNQTQPPNITTNSTQTQPPNITNLIQTRPPNITTNPTQSGPLTVTNIIKTSSSNTQSIEITGRDNCKRDRACFSAPPSCNPSAQGSCYFLSTRGVGGNADNFTFEISGETDGYIGAGLSRDKSGQGATVYSCAKVNSELRFFRSTLNNQILTQDNTFIPGNFRGSMNGRKIQCIFTAAGLSNNARAATTDNFVLFLTGSVSNGSLDSPVTRLATNGSVDLSNPNSTDVTVITPSIDATTTAPNSTASTATAALNTTASPNTTSSNSTAPLNTTAPSNTTASNVTVALNTTASTASGVSTANNGTANDKVTKDNCKKDRACFSTPANCDPSSSSSCFFASTRGVNGDSDNLTFELSGDANGYIAVGLSRDKKEGDNDTVYSCANDNGVAKFIRATLNNAILTPDNTFNPRSFRGSLSGTRIQCIFVAAGLSSITRAANTDTFLYFFTGNYANGTLGSPVTRMSTNSSVDLTSTNSSDVVIIAPTTNTTTTTVSTTAKPATTAGSNALHHAASQAALVILSGILAVLLL
ncbi:mucin-5AC-like isoform X2 [Sinocyclocheilus rhinocerous]|uniref:mucin-5AC-like isoform X2 n=1 Tax=Sinocyclocheilus rhinocerous TaxID=307959 RepID=UPI0007B7FB9D|nr:PREDICTED: mucin-5AC-like isoform X2 [Sinocyclocheilus rhinocerous]